MSRRNDSPSTIRLAFVGDICLAGGLQADLLERGTNFPFAQVREVLESADLVVGNLECCIVDQRHGLEPPHNRMIVPEHLASGLSHSGITVVSLANNHTLDGGEEGLASTRRFLEKQGVQYFGAGANIQEAESPLLVPCKGKVFAFLGACDVPQVFATVSRSGVAPFDAARLRRRISECKDKADIVVVSIHAGLEFTAYPSPKRVRLSRWLAELGADLLVQHHPHVCQGIEEFSGSIIAYSLGNFVFRVTGNEYLESKTGTDWGLILEVDVSTARTQRQLSYRTRPVTITAQNQTILSEGRDRDIQLQFVAEVSAALANWSVLRRQRVARCLTEARSTAYSLYYLGCRNGVLAMLRAAVEILKSPYERRWMYSLLTGGLFG